MRVVIAGAGNVGRSIAKELLDNGHQVLLIDRDPAEIRADQMPDAQWLLADCCEMSTLREADIASADCAIAATGDDKANLVLSLLSKTEFGVPRTVARVNHPKNEWMFDEVWGVDVAVSTPRLMSALVEEAVTVGDVVALFRFKSGQTELVELRLSADSHSVGRSLSEFTLPVGANCVAVIRDGIGRPVDPHEALQEADELLFIARQGTEKEISHLLGAAHTQAAQ